MMRLLCLGYLFFLTVLLFVADPFGMLGAQENRGLHFLEPVSHLLSFWVLTVLAFAARWPVPRWAIVVSLAAYGGMTEIVQGFLPPRRMEWGDWWQDVGGVALGAAMFWGLCAVLHMRGSSLPAIEAAASENVDG